MTHMIYKIKRAEDIQAKDIQILTDGISEYAKLKKGHLPIEPFAFFIKDENDLIQGGCNGNVGYGCVYIDQLWVAEALRGKGYGTQLMKLAEDFGKEKGCVSAAVNTMDWEAPEFYKKLGYRIEFERQGLSKNSIYYFLRKDL